MTLEVISSGSTFGADKKNRPSLRRGGLHVPVYRPCAGIIQIRFNGSAANSRHLSPVPPSPPKKISGSNVVTSREGVDPGDGGMAGAAPYQVLTPHRQSAIVGPEENVADMKKGFFTDLLDGTFTLISRTWLTSLLVGGVLFIPTSILFGWAYDAFLPAMESLGKSAQNLQSSVLIAFGLSYLWLLLAVLAQGFVYLFVRACVTEHASRAVRGEPASTFSVMKDVITRKYGKLIGLRVLQLAILGIVFAAACAVGGVAAAIFGGLLKSTALAALLSMLLVLGGLIVVIWLAVRYTVTLESLVIDGTGIDQSIDASMALVRHRWWRVFGYTLLFSLMVSFASSLIATPVMFFSNIRQFIHVMERLLRETSGSRSFNSMFRDLLVGMGRRLAILQYVQSVLGCFVSPVFMTLLFLELKKRPVPEPQPADVSVTPQPVPPEAAL